MRSIHDRMPVILEESDYQRWLAPEETAADSLSDLLAPYSAAGMEAHPVSKAVNNPRVDTPELVERAPEQSPAAKSPASEPSLFPDSG
jgi:putative SOS response-associated peptidase YedK